MNRQLEIVVSMSEYFYVYSISFFMCVKGIDIKSQVNS